MTSFYIRYHSKVLAALSAPLAVLADSLGDGEITGDDGKKIAAALIVPLLVYIFPKNADASEKPVTYGDLQAQINDLKSRLGANQ